MDQTKDSSSIHSVSGPVQSGPVDPIDCVPPPIAAFNSHGNVGCAIEHDANHSNKKLSMDIKCIKSEIKCLERAVDLAFERSRDLSRTVADLSNQCVVNDVNNDTIREAFYNFKKEVLAHLSTLEARVEILELAADVEM